jgi:hypothetical protein
LDFFKLIQSLDELIYEVVGFLLFYPLTLWRIIRSPLGTMKAAEEELAQTERKQFLGLMPPPLFLLLTLIILHSVELGTVGESELVLSDRGFSALITSDTSLIIFEILMFSILPLTAAVRLVMARRVALDKEVLRAPFFAQCYAGGLFALLWDAAKLIAENSIPFSAPAHLAIQALALIWLFLVEGRWFSAELKVSLARGFGQAALMIGQWLALLMLIAVVLP